MAKQEIETFIEAHKLTMTTVFVPWSQSRNKGEKSPSLNWRVTINQPEGQGTRALLKDIDYMAGSAHCPSYDTAVDRNTVVRYECENGHKFRNGAVGSLIKIEPDFVDVLYSLARDADVLNFSDFEGWASEMGYDPDSRKAEKTYRACMDIAERLRAGLGEAGLNELTIATEGY